MAKEFQHHHPDTTFFVVDRPWNWVYVRYPQGLIRVYTSSIKHSFVFEFKHESEARTLHASIGWIGEYVHDTVNHVYRIYIPKK
jgi:hypothetical protein